MATRSSAKKQFKYSGTLVLRRKSVLDLGAHLLDAASNLFGQKVTLQLISNRADPETKSGKLSKRAPVGGWLLSGGVDDVQLKLDFEVDEDFGLPGAFSIRNQHPNEFYLKSLTLRLPQQEQPVEFPCNSWVYNQSKYKSDRVFFSNNLHLPKDTPDGLIEARKIELQSLRGDGTGVREDWDRVYDYATYNDLGNPDSDQSLQRPVLGGSAEYPYPRRCRTGRDPAKNDKTAESLTSFADNFYVPSDERFSSTKASEFLTSAIKAAAQSLLPSLESTFTRDETFDSLKEVKNLYVEGVDMSNCKPDEGIPDPFEVVKFLSESNTGNLLMYPIPAVINANETAWMSDDEFARQMISGLNPLVIQLLEVFPPVSSLDPAKYGPQKSAITEAHIRSQLEGNTVQQALKNKKMFILDYHDAYMPYLTRINSLETIHAYASRTLLYLKADGTLKPVAIELSLPPGVGLKQQRVFLPPTAGEVDWIWNLAKAHVATNDSGYHQLISHFLRTHAVIEPFAIATHRNLSAVHPLNPFLIPHFRNTLSINARGRQSLANANGIIEKCFSTGKYSMELSSVVYRTWRFDEQGLPADLLKRKMAVKDESSKHGLRLAIEDYPFAADGLEIWTCIETWTRDYVDSCYKEEASIASDSELQAWWKEIINVGHGDKKNESWWVPLDSKKNLVNVLTTVIWLASAHHAAVNFGQYAYAGYMPNHPTATHKEIPVEGSEEYKQLLNDPEGFFLSAVSTKAQATSVMTTIEILSTHASDEEYLGQRVVQNWTSNAEAQTAFTRFSASVKTVEDLIISRNKNTKLKNRSGPARVPYTLLFPSSTPGHTGRGIPNSVSICFDELDTWKLDCPVVLRVKSLQIRHNTRELNTNRFE